MFSIRKLFLTLRYVFFGKNYKKRRSHYFFSLLQVSEFTNKVDISNMKMLRSKLVINGQRNEFHGESSLVNKSTILIQGNNNKIIISDNCQVHHLFLAVIGNDCVIEIGRNAYFHGGYMMAGGESSLIKIGEDCLFAHDVDIMNSDSHQICSNGSVINSPQNVILGNHVWVGAHTSILKGVRIEDNAVIGTRSVVTKDIRKNTLNVGIPCKTIKEGISWSL